MSANILSRSGSPLFDPELDAFFALLRLSLILPPLLNLDAKLPVQRRGGNLEHSRRQLARSIGKVDCFLNVLPLLRRAELRQRVAH